MMLILVGMANGGAENLSRPMDKTRVGTPG